MTDIRGDSLTHSLAHAHTQMHKYVGPRIRRTSRSGTQRAAEKKADEEEEEEMQTQCWITKA